MPRSTTCADCDTCILHRGARAKRCVNCQNDRERQKQREWYRAEVAVPAYRQHRRQSARRVYHLRAIASPERHKRLLQRNRLTQRKRRLDPEYRATELHRARQTSRHRYRVDPEYRAKKLVRGNRKCRQVLPKLLHLQDGLCGRVGKPGGCHQPLGDDLTTIHVDHIYPLAHGGTDELDNLQALHARCNLAKASRVPSSSAKNLHPN